MGLTFDLPVKTSLVPAYAKGSPTPTYSRASVAYVEDWEGLWKAVLSGEARFRGARRVKNLFVSSEDLSHAAWTDFDGASHTPNTVTFTASASSQTRQLAPPQAGGTANKTFVVSAKLSVGSGTATCRLDNTHSGVLANTSPNFTVTTTPTVFSFSVTNGAGAGNGFQQGGLQNGSGGGAKTINVHWMQIEDVTGQSNQNPSEYVSVGVESAPYHGANVDGVKYFDTLNGNTVASNVVTEATGLPINPTNGGLATVCDAGGPFGYHAEGARTNRCLHSNTFENAAWVATTMTVDDDSAVAPDGTTTAATLTAAGANSTLIQDLGVVASASKTGGLFIKRKTGSGAVELTMDGGATWTAITVTADWTRVSKNQTLANEDFGIRIVTDTDAVYVWNGQVVTAAFLSTPIRTTTAAVTRNADLLTYSPTSNFNNANGTAFMEAVLSTGTGGDALRLIGDGVPASLTPLVFNGSPTEIRFYDGNYNTGASLTLSGLPQKVATRWSGVLGTAFVAGVGATPTVFSGSMGLTTVMSIGTDDGTNGIFGTIRNVRIYDHALSDLHIAALPGGPSAYRSVIRARRR